MLDADKIVVRIQREKGIITNQQVLSFKDDKCNFFNLDIDTESRKHIENIACPELFDMTTEKTTGDGWLIRVRTYTRNT